MHKKEISQPQANKVDSLQLGIIYPHAAGIDVGSMEMLVSYINSKGEQQVEQYGSCTEDLRELSALLKRNGVTHVAMEATGVYWMSLYDMLATDGFKVSVVNAQHFKNVAGQKTDVQDCQWIHQLHAHGLLRDSHIAEDIYRTLRNYVQERELLARQKKDVLNRIHKVLTLMNVKYQHLISDIEGVAGMHILQNIARGANTPDTILADVDTRLLKAKREDLARSLEGIFKVQYIRILNHHLNTLRFYQGEMLAYEKEIEDTLKLMLPQEAEAKAIGRKTTRARKNQFHFNLKQYLHKIAGVDLTSIDGLDEHSVLVIIGVVGLNMDKWPTAEHFVSWLNLSPRPRKSGGKVIGYQKRINNNVATQAFRMGAQTLWQHKGTLGHLYRRLSHSKGSKKAIKAVARRLAVIFYNMVKKKTAYDPKIIAIDEEKIRARKIARLRKEAEKLGCKLEALVA